MGNDVPTATLSWVTLDDVESYAAQLFAAQGVRVDASSLHGLCSALRPSAVIGEDGVARLRRDTVALLVRTRLRGLELRARHTATTSRIVTLDAVAALAVKVAVALRDGAPHSRAQHASVLGELAAAVLAASECSSPSPVAVLSERVLFDAQRLTGDQHP